MSKEPKPRKYLVKSPVPNFVGVGAAGVQFAYGRAEVNEGWVLEWYKEHGYEVSEIVEQPKDLDKLTVAELKERAQAEGLEFDGKATKADLIALLGE